MLIYLYRPSLLRKDLQAPAARQLLGRFGYPDASPEVCVAYLARRFRAEEDFPHEIGLFLGYPPEDVEGFIRFHGQGYKASGLWKVYGNTAQAEDLFERFRNCRSSLYRQWKKGRNIDQLTVSAVRA